MPEGSENRRALLRFDGIAGKSTVYLNGCLMYHNFSAYNTFEIDITDYVYYDKENIIAVYVNTEGFEGWWYQGGGIYRDVHLTVTEPVAIDLWLSLIHILAAFYITTILKTTSSGFLFRPLSENSINSLLVFARTIGFVILWSVTNWAIATLFGGIGKFREIYLVITYSLFPVVIGNTVYIVFSHMLNLTEGEFLTIFLVFTELLAVFMVIVGSVIIHDISFGKFVGIAVMTILGMPVSYTHLDVYKRQAVHL